MAWASFSALEGFSLTFPLSSRTFTSFRFSSSSKLMSKEVPLVPPYWKLREPDTVLTGIVSDRLKALSPVIWSSAPPTPPIPDTV